MLSMLGAGLAAAFAGCGGSSSPPGEPLEITRFVARDRTVVRVSTLTSVLDDKISATVAAGPDGSQTLRLRATKKPDGDKPILRIGIARCLSVSMPEGVDARKVRAQADSDASLPIDKRNAARLWLARLPARQCPSVVAHATS